ncbi:uncharacterized protein ARMOST_18219 [Armillaria ostoyae]|uniref:Uncharacterized protein n=1 Tax=Armillaria ostoyae TaxID=47428 RepID=A0A284S165_ARMOS|nr:uncharacterized protein ARMOST_18219 [Armillaria ostoyae]
MGTAFELVFVSVRTDQGFALVYYTWMNTHRPRYRLSSRSKAWVVNSGIKNSDMLCSEVVRAHAGRSTTVNASNQACSVLATSESECRPTTPRPNWNSDPHNDCMPVIVSVALRTRSSYSNSYWRTRTS